MLSPTMDFHAQCNKFQKTIESVPYLIHALKKCGFRITILINAYNSYAISHIIYPILTSCSIKAKTEMIS